jgi:hypothetical protein
LTSFFSVLLTPVAALDILVCCVMRRIVILDLQVSQLGMKLSYVGS